MLKDQHLDFKDSKGFKVQLEHKDQLLDFKDSKEFKEQLVLKE